MREGRRLAYMGNSFEKNIRRGVQQQHPNPPRPFGSVGYLPVAFGSRPDGFMISRQALSVATTAKPVKDQYRRDSPMYLRAIPPPRLTGPQVKGFSHRLSFVAVYLFIDHSPVRLSQGSLSALSRQLPNAVRNLAGESPHSFGVY